ncbi:dienelactone hydrolase family protein [Amycolatopsis thermoflava]|uniref:hypothetical protein n=1 Tax=Amycolatopsis thermoflava TaxID=84480 RepID=UPI000416B82C|nr:hypothetical protein [Amycolatopsis thermoflava]
MPVPAPQPRRSPDYEPAEADEYFEEDLPSARELASSTPHAELFVYPGDQHLFADSSLPAHAAEAAGTLLDRVRAFLASVP